MKRPLKALPRTLKPGQSCSVWIFDTRSMTSKRLFETDAVLLEAPNWTMQADTLILNGDGVLWRIPVDAPALEPITITGVPPLNNDHVLDPDGKHIFLSAYDDWQIYRAPLAGGAARRITGEGSPEGLNAFPARRLARRRAACLCRFAR